MIVSDLEKYNATFSSKEFSNEVVDYLTNKSFDNVNTVYDLFKTNVANKKEGDKTNYCRFINEVIFPDYCNIHAIDYGNIKEIEDQKDVCMGFQKCLNHNKRIILDSGMLYDVVNDINNAEVILNVSGDNIISVLEPLYKSLKDNEFPCIIRTHYLKGFNKGYTDSIAISTSKEKVNELINIITYLSLPIVNLINKPSIIYANVNDYIGIDLEEDNKKLSEELCNAINDALTTTVDEIIKDNGNEFVEIDEQSLSTYINNADNKLLANIEILKYMINISSSYKNTFVDNLTKLVDELTSEKIEVDVEQPDISYESEELDNPLMLTSDLTDLLVQDDTPKDLLVKEEVPTDLLVQEENKEDVLTPEELETVDVSEEPLVEEPSSSSVENEKLEEEELTPTEKFTNEFINRTPSTEEYLDSLLAGVTKVDETPSIEEANVAPQIDITPLESNNDILSGTVKVDEMTEEQKNAVTNAMQEVDKSGEVLASVLEELSNTNNNTELNENEIQSLANNEIDSNLDYNRASKYSILVNDLNELSKNVPGTDFTLLDYFDEQQLLSHIDPNSKYKILSDEVFTGREFVNECIIRYVLANGNTTLDNIFKEYGVESLDNKENLEEKNPKSKGLLGLFKRKK
jgi:hypothetical protein